MTPRDYQTAAIVGVQRHWENGARAVLLVAPTGAGKTVLGSELAVGHESVLWVAHRRELVRQAARRLAQRFGRHAVGVVMPGEPSTATATIQVGTVQTFAASANLPPARLVVLDEAHHYVAEEWRQLVDRCGEARVLGLTATPERGDGTPLGDIFERLVVAASYSELIRDGFLVPAAMLQPPEDLGNDLAQDPLDAWVKHSGGAQTFVCCARVAIAYDVAKRFRDHGVIAETVEGETARRERDDILARFRAGKTSVLTYVDTLTEGVDVPEAGCAVLAKAFGTVGAYIQTVGRVLRPAPGKTHATVIDLTGATLRHGAPTKDRGYSLEGRPISGEGPPREGGGGAPTFEQSVRGVDLRPAGWCPVAPASSVQVSAVDEGARRAEYQRLLALARQHSMRDGFAAVKYREKFGEEPRREWA